MGMSLCSIFFYSCFRYGNCVLYRHPETENFCDKLFMRGVDHVYIPRKRNSGRFSALIAFISGITPLIHNPATNAKCLDMIDRLLCHYYVPPCGNSTVFEPPTPVCPHVCNYITEICEDAWEEIFKMAQNVDEYLAPKGLTLINCSNPSEYLPPVPHCCSNLGIDISKY